MPPRAKQRANGTNGTSIGGRMVLGERRDLPERTAMEAEQERRACFERAWAQKEARDREKASERK